MKKLFVFALVFVLLLSGCGKEPEKIVPEVPDVPEISQGEISESVPEEPEEKSQDETSESASESISEEEPKIEDEWEKFLREMNENGISENDIGVLENAGFEREELKTMYTNEISRQVAIIKYGISEEKIACAERLIENSEEAESDENFVFRGEDRKIKTEPVEKLIEAIGKNESYSIFGILAGNTEPFYFELSFEPGKTIKFTRISKYLVAAAEFSIVYDNENFYHFTNSEGVSFSLIKTKRFPEDKLEFSANLDVPEMPVTLEAAKEKATEIQLCSDGYTKVFGNLYQKNYGSNGKVFSEDYSEFAGDYYKNLVPECDGVFDIEGKPYYKIIFCENGIHIGGTYYICAESSELVFAGSEVDGSLIALAISQNPRVLIETE